MFAIAASRERFIEQEVLVFSQPEFVLLADPLEAVEVDLALVILLCIHTETADELEPLAAETPVQLLHERQSLVLRHLVVNLAVDCVVLGDFPALGRLAALYPQLLVLVLAPV